MASQVKKGDNKPEQNQFYKTTFFIVFLNFKAVSNNQSTAAGHLELSFTFIDLHKSIRQALFASRNSRP
jgi:hypothetical protein